MKCFAQRPGRIALFTLLYLSEGAPIGFIWWALPTLLRAAGVEVPRITALTALLVLPWVLKFLWAPLVDAWRPPRWGFRWWIICTQGVMGLTLLPLIWFDPVSQFNVWGLLLVVHAFAAATQDVAIDALAIHVVPGAQRGLLNGCMQAGMLLGRSLFGGGALLVVSTFGLAWVILALVGCIWVTTVLVFLLNEPVAETERQFKPGDLLERLRVALRARATWWGLGFALVAAAGFEATGQLAGPFLLDRGLSEQTIGQFFGVVVVGATLIGGLIGGSLADRMGRLRTVAISLVGFVVMIVGLAITDLGWQTVSIFGMLSWLTGMYCFVGLFTSSSYALFMDLTDARLGGTQFSMFMAATNGCESWSAWAGGRIVGAGSYPAAFLAMSGVSLLGLLFLIPLARERWPGRRSCE